MAMPIPVELLREITLIYLSEAFWDLIVEPSSDDKDWDPLSSLLHTSSQFRQVTIECILPIFGEPSLQKSSPSIANYRGVLAELRCINITAYTGNPRQLLLEPAHATSIVNPPSDCKSPLLHLARFFAEVVLQWRLDQSRMNDSDDGQRLLKERHKTPPLINCLMEGVPERIRWRVFMPICSHLNALFRLVQRTFYLYTLCRIAVAIFPRFWLLPGNLFESDSRMHTVREILTKAIDGRSTMGILSMSGLICEDLPVPQAVLDAIQLQKAWSVLEPPSNFPENDTRVEFCRWIKDTITSILSADEMETLLSVSQIRQENGRAAVWFFLVVFSFGCVLFT